MQDLLRDLNDPQRQAVTHVDGPLLVLAGAGSGKTRVITRRVAYMIQEGIAPWNILAITFTNKAAKEMRQRVEDLGAPRGSTVCTFHALCVRLLREFAAEAGLTHNFTIYDRDDQLKIVKQAVEACDLSTSNFPPSKVHASISAAKNDLLTPQAMADKAGRFQDKCIAQVYAQYEKLLTASNALDFDDLLLRTAWLLGTRKDIASVLGRRYKYVSIDEYQDTNRAQYVVAHSIAAEHENICATGDPDQSIYAWRGADIKNILEFEQDYPNATVIRLEENYRSRSPILTAASSLISRNKMRKEKRLWTSRQGGGDVVVVTCDHEHAEAQLVARRIASYHASGGRWDDVAVFYRVNSLSRLVEEQLMRQGIPYQIARGVEFYNRKEIKDVIAYLRVLVNPLDDLSCERIINVPARGIGATTVNRLQEFAAGAHVSLIEACRRAAQAGLGNAAVAKVMGFAAVMDALAADIDRPVKAVMEDVLTRSGMEAMLSAKDEDTQQARSNVDELVSAAAEFDSRLDSSGADQEGAGDRIVPLEEYLHQISLVSDVDHFEGGSGSVTLMTLHAAKGLEFPVVFMVGCEEGLLPFQRADENVYDVGAAMAKLEEERRLAFVGMTRSQEQLVMTCARRRMFRGQTTEQTPSKFLSEIGTEGVTFENACTSGTLYGLQKQRFRGGFIADHEERAMIEAISAADDGGRAGTPLGADDFPPEPPPFDEMGGALPLEYSGIRKGAAVHSSKFGAGKVTSVGNEPWPHTRVKVHFYQYGDKTLVLSLAKLTVGK